LLKRLSRKLLVHLLCKLVRQMEKYHEKLIDYALEQIVNDVNGGDLTAIEELLKFVPIEKLMGFLKEEKANDTK